MTPEEKRQLQEALDAMPVDEGEVLETLEGDIMDLVERAVADDDTIDVRLISPGWGSSGYYSEELLKRDGAKAWPMGTHMHLDHPSESDQRSRPEGSVRDLAAALASDDTVITFSPFSLA